MSCNCKNKSGVIQDSVSNEGVKINTQTIVSYTLRFLGFMMMLVLLPLLNLYIIWLMFKMLVLNKNIDLKPLLASIGAKFTEKENDQDEEEFLGDEFDELTDDDVVLLDSEDITNKVTE